MIVWAFVVVVMSILSYLADVGVISILDLRIPVLGASLMSAVLLLCGLGMMGRIKYMVSKGEKENLLDKVKKLEKRLEEPKNANGSKAE